MKSVRLARWTALAVAAVTLGLAYTAQAGPSDPKLIPADSKWIIHVDVDAMRSSSFVEKAWNEVMKRFPKVQEHLGKVCEKMGINIEQDLHGLTAYGKAIGKPEGVLIVDAKIDPKHLEELAAKAPEHKACEYGKYKLHSWAEHGHTHWGALVGDEKIVFASCDTELKGALDLIDGKGESLAARMPQQRPIPPGTMVSGFLRDLNEAKVPEEMALVKQTRVHFFAIGENEGKLNYRGMSIMTNEEVVPQVKAVLEGIKALAKIHAQKDEAANRIADGMEITAEGNRVGVRWSAPVDDVWNQIVLHAKLIMEHRAKHQKHEAK